MSKRMTQPERARTFISTLMIISFIVFLRLLVQSIQCYYRVRFLSEPWRPDKAPEAAAARP